MSQLKLPGGARIRGVRVTPPIEEPPTDVTVSINRSTKVMDSLLRLGVIFTHHTMQGGSDATAITRMRNYLRDQDLDAAVMHGHNFGSNGPLTVEAWRDRKALGETDMQIAGNRANWGTGLSAWNSRIQQVRSIFPNASTAEKMLIVYAMPPGWTQMNGGSYSNPADDPLGQGRTWSNLDGHDLIRHTDAKEAPYIEMLRQICLEHPDITQLAIIQEQKGNFTPAKYASEIDDFGLSNQFNYIAYCRFHNALWNAVNGLGVEVMGPYLVIEGNDADAIAADVRSEGGTFANFVANAQSKPPLMSSNARNKRFLQEYYARVALARGLWTLIDHKPFDGENDAAHLDAYFPHIWRFIPPIGEGMEVIKTLPGYSAARKFCAAETYWTKVQHTQLPGHLEQGALAAEVLRVELLAGMDLHLRWSPEQNGYYEDPDTGVPDYTRPENRCNLFKSCRRAWPGETLSVNGGEPLPAYGSYKAFADHFRAGKPIYQTAVSNPALVSALSNATHTLLINKRNATTTVGIGANVYTLTPWEVRVIAA